MRTIKFDTDKDLGQTIESKEIQSFGQNPNIDFKDVVFAAGGTSVSYLSRFKFVSKAPGDHKTFFIAFVCKLRSKIHRRQINNPSQWFIFKKISNTEIHTLSKQNLLDMYGFDIYKFFQSDYFKQGVKDMQKYINDALTKYIPEYVNQHGSEEAKDNLFRYDGGGTTQTIAQAIQTYASSIEDSLRYITVTRCNDKYYKLPNIYQIPVDESENLTEDNAESVIGYAIGTKANGKLQFVNFSVNVPYLTDFPYSTTKEKMNNDSLKLLSKPMFGRLNDAQNYKVSYMLDDAEEYFRKGGTPKYQILDDEKDIASEDEQKDLDNQILDAEIEEVLKDIYN